MKKIQLFIFIIILAILSFIKVNNTSISNKNVFSGSFHISQYIDNAWQEIIVEPFTTTYQTKTFSIAPQKGQVKIRIEQKEVSYGDIELVQLLTCGNILKPKYAKYVLSQNSIIDDIQYDDNNVVVNHENPIELVWQIPDNCFEDATLTIKANEYESPEKNAFRFPEWGIEYQSYTFQNNGSLVVDGVLNEIDGIMDPQYYPFWKASTGHPSNNTLMYIKDDQQYVYFALDILADNTDDFGKDWVKIFVQNSQQGIEKEYKVDDYTKTYGICSFGITSKVSYKHQMCEIKIPKSEIKDNAINFIIRYYGTMGGSGEPPIIDSIDEIPSSPTSDSTPSFTGSASDSDGVIINASYMVYIWQDGSYSYYLNGDCQSDDDLFDESQETFTCTIDNDNALTIETLYQFRLIISDNDHNDTRNDNVAEFDYVIPSPTPSPTLTLTPTLFPSIIPTSTPVPNISSSSTGISLPQIPQQTIVDSGGVFFAIVDSQTNTQPVLTIIQPNTFNFDAYLSSSAIQPSSLVLPSINTTKPQSKTNKTTSNARLYGGLNGILGVRVNGNIYFQVGNIQNIWYKAYAPQYKTDNSAKIIPELQSKPSIIALSYTNNDIIIPGRKPNKKGIYNTYNPKRLKLMYSSDGYKWSILSSSVVDPINKTVAAIHRPSGYYMIVGR